MHAKGKRILLISGGGGGGGGHIFIKNISVFYMFNRGGLYFQPKFSKRNIINQENKFWDNSRTRGESFSISAIFFIF